LSEKEDTLRSQLLLLTIAASLGAQTITPMPAPTSSSSVLPFASSTPVGEVQPTDVIFPHFAVGGGWNTTLVIVNMSPQTVTFDQYFFDQNGNPLPVTFQTIPGGQIITTAHANGSPHVSQMAPRIASTAMAGAVEISIAASFRPRAISPELPFEKLIKESWSLSRT
jgi:hypothetical protein